MSNRGVAFTAERLLQVLHSFPAAKAYMVGFSGGADSTALLHALNIIGARLALPVSAVHVNHGLHANSNLWQQQCERFCDDNGIGLTSVRIELEHNKGKGLEAEARHLRYQAIMDLMASGTSLLTAHHADDQAETLLLNLMRGSGVDGLSAMPESRRLGKGFLQRPLLQFQNSALTDYLVENGVTWIEDPSNQHLNHDRNFVRHELIPSLEERWPGVSKRLLLTRQAMSGARHLLEGLADEYLEQNLRHRFVLQLNDQTNTDENLLKLVIRRWLQRAGVPTIPAYRLDAFCQQIQLAGNQQNVRVKWNERSLRLFKNQLWLCDDVEIGQCPTVQWAAEDTVLELGPVVGQLQFVNGAGSVQSPEKFIMGKPAGELRVGSRKDMGTLGIDNGSQHNSLKNIFQAASIPPWLRDCVPLCNLNGELMAIGDWYFNKEFGNWMNKSALRLRWKPRHPLLQFIQSQR